MQYFQMIHKTALNMFKVFNYIYIYHFKKLAYLLQLFLNFRGPDDERAADGIF